MEGKSGSVPNEGEIKGALGILEEKKSKLADKLEDRKSKLGNCTNLFAANFNAARGMAAKGWESSSQSQEDADAVKQERAKKPVVEKNLTKKVRRNLFGKQHSFQNIKVQQEMQQKKRELGELLRRKENLKEESKEASSKVLKNIKDARQSTQESKSGDESSAIVFPASPSKSVRQSQVSTWVTMTTTSAQQALPKLTHSKAPRSRSPRRREKSSSGKHQDDSKWSVYQRVKAGRRPGNQQGGKEGRRSRFSYRENRKQEKKSFDFFNNKCSFFDSIETKEGKDEGPLDFLFADGHNDEEPRVTLHLHITLQFFLVSKLNFFNLAFRNIKCRR